MKLLTISDFAKKLGINSNIIYMGAFSGQIPGIQKKNNLWALPETSLPLAKEYSCICMVCKYHPIWVCGRDDDMLHFSRSVWEDQKQVVGGAYRPFGIRVNFFWLWYSSSE